VPATSGPRGGAAVDGVLSATYPGAGGAFGFLAFPFGAFADPENPPASAFSRSGIAPQYAPDPSDAFQAAAPLPFGRFHDRDAARRWFEDGKQDPAPHRPMADSRWGDVLDVLVADEGGRWVEALGGGGGGPAGYRALIWANSSMDTASRGALEDYAKGGGTVVVAAGAVGPADGSLTGVSPSGELRAVRAWRWSTEAAESGYFLAAALSLNSTMPGVEVLAVSVPEGLPLVVRRPLGRGVVFTVLVPYLGADRLAPPALRLLDHVLVPLQSVSIVEGAPTLYWTSTKLMDGVSRVAAIANNADAVWEGKLSVQLRAQAAGACARAECKDVWTGDSIACSKTASETAGGSVAAVIALEIEPHDVVLIKVACANATA
jgi:hypothetical protein